MSEWTPTNSLRWYRPAHATDNERKLQQLWRHLDGREEWYDVMVVLED